MEPRLESTHHNGRSHTLQLRPEGQQKKKSTKIFKTGTAEHEPKDRALWGCPGPLLVKLAPRVILSTL